MNRGMWHLMTILVCVGAGAVLYAFGDYYEAIFGDKSHHAIDTVLNDTSMAPIVQRLRWGALWGAVLGVFLVLSSEWRRWRKGPEDEAEDDSE